MAAGAVCGNTLYQPFLVMINSWRNTKLGNTGNWVIVEQVQQHLCRVISEIQVFSIFSLDKNAGK